MEPTNDKPLLDRDEVLEDDVVDDNNVEDKRKKEENVERLLGEVKENLQSSDALAKLIADPDIRKIIEARQSGEKISIVTGEPKKDSVDDKEPEDIEDLSNRELIKFMTKVVSSKVGEIVDTKLESVTEELKGFGQFIDNAKQTDVQNQITKARAKYKDFDDLRKEMVDLHGANPGLTVEELYEVSKSRKAGPDKEKNPESERPSEGASTRPSMKETRKKPLPPGASGFEQLVQEGLARI